MCRSDGDFELPGLIEAMSVLATAVTAYLSSRSIAILSPPRVMTCNLSPSTATTSPYAAGGGLGKTLRAEQARKQDDEQSYQGHGGLLE
jgi:hypothetical protein